MLAEFRKNPGFARAFDGFKQSLLEEIAFVRSVKAEDGLDLERVEDMKSVMDKSIYHRICNLIYASLLLRKYGYYFALKRH